MARKAYALGYPFQLTHFTATESPPAPAHRPLHLPCRLCLALRSAARAISSRVAAIVRTTCSCHTHGLVHSSLAFLFQFPLLVTPSLPVLSFLVVVLPLFFLLALVLLVVMLHTKSIKAVVLLPIRQSSSLYVNQTHSKSCLSISTQLLAALIAYLRLATCLPIRRYGLRGSFSCSSLRQRHWLHAYIHADRHAPISCSTRTLHFCASLSLYVYIYMYICIYIPLSL